MNEIGVFRALFDALVSLDAATGMEAFMVTPTANGVYSVGCFGTMQQCSELTPIDRWLRDDGSDLDLTDTEQAVASALLAIRLASERGTLGGIVLAGGDRLRRERQWTDCLTRSATSALSGLRQRRLSHLVLEALEQSEEAISFYDINGGVLFSNDAYHRVFPHYPARDQLIGMSHLDLYRLDLEAGIIDDPVAKRDPDAYLAERARLADELSKSQREVQSIAGRTYIYTRTRSKTGATMSRRIDMTEQMEAEAQLRLRERELHRLAFSDLLTGLHNRAFLKQQLERFETEIQAKMLAGISVFLLDLNNFRALNDTYGHEGGDVVLKTIARRLRDNLHDANVIARLGGDEFVVVFEGAWPDQELAALAQRLTALAAEPIDWHDLQLTMRASIGIVRYVAADGPIATILGDADFAVSEAKKMRRSAFRIFSPDLRSAAVERLALVEDLRKALQRQEFVLYYQPQFAAEDTQLVGFEVLARWKHPTRGTVGPDVFIPLLEEIGLIEALGEWVLRAACAEAALWPADLHVAVNVSPTQVRSSRFGLVLADALMRSGLSPHRLELEITESVVLENDASVRAQLESWKQLGVRIALDDFGHGYSSLGYLSAFPIDKIKIDRGFVGGFDPAHPSDTAGIILRMVIELGRSLGMRVTAEGVETTEQLDFLRQQNCDEIQGFLLGRPTPLPEAANLIVARSGRMTA